MWEKIKAFFGVKKQTGIQKATADFRKAEFLISGYQDNIWSGDSVAFGAELLVEGDQSVIIHSTAIPGDDTESFLLRLNDNILKFKPKKVLLHLGGNDLLANKSLSKTVENMKTIAQKLKKGGVKKIGWVEVLPLGDRGIIPPSFIELNLVKIPQLIFRVKQLGLFDVIEIRKFLQKDNGFIKDEYNGGDNVHCNAKSYEEVWVPIIKEWFKK